MSKTSRFEFTFTSEGLEENTISNCYYEIGISCLLSIGGILGLSAKCLIARSFCSVIRGNVMATV